MIKTMFKASILFAGFFMVNAANAAFPVGLWQVDQFDLINKTKINTMQTCFSNNGTLKHGSSMSSINWTGTWKRKEDLVLMRMNNINGVDVAENTLIAYSPAKVMAGHGQSWSISDSSTGFYTSSVWTFKGPSC